VIGTLIHKLVLRRLSARLSEIGVSNDFEIPAPRGSKKVWSDADGFIDLLVTLRIPERPVHIEAQLYELKPNNPHRYQSYVSEVEHYVEYFPRSFRLMRVDRCLKGKILHFVKRVAPNVFDPIIIQSPGVDVSIRFWPAIDNKGSVDGLIVYEWEYNVKPSTDGAVAVQQHIENVKHMLRINAMSNVAAQVARSNLLAADIILAAYGIGVLIGISAAAGAGTAATVTAVEVVGAAKTVGTGGSIALPTAATGVKGLIIDLNSTALIAATKTVANDVVSMVAGLVAYFSAKPRKQSPPGRQ
jgi:hypothetical protein